MPQELTEAFTTLGALEFNFENGNWREAEAAMKRLEKLFSHIAETRGGSISPRLLYDFGYSFGKLQVSLSERDEKKSQAYYIDVHDLFLRLSASFAYTVPPALTAIDDYVREAQGWVGRGDLKQVVYEMREIGRYFRNLYPTLEEKGVDSSQVWAFHRQINQVMAAAESKNIERTAKSLKILADKTTVLLALFLDTGRPDSADANLR